MFDKSIMKEKIEKAQKNHEQMRLHFESLEVNLSMNDVRAVNNCITLIKVELKEATETLSLKKD